MHDAHFAINVSDVSLNRVLITSVGIMLLHFLLGHVTHVLFRAQCCPTGHCIHRRLHLVKLFVRPLDLVSQHPRLLGIWHNILNSNLLAVLRTEVVPINIGDLEQGDDFLLLFLLHSLLALFLDFLAVEQLQLSFDHLVKLCLGHVFLISGKIR